MAIRLEPIGHADLSASQTGARAHYAPVENLMHIHRMECVKTPNILQSSISIQLSYSASTSLFQRVKATVNH